MINIISIADDGVTYINIYSNGKTELGRMLSNFYQFPIKTIDGNFLSVEGYWHWLGIGDCKEKERIRYLYGIEAKRFGTLSKGKYGWRIDDDFENKILKAIWFKVRRNIDLFTPENKDLPFEHYYVFGENNVHDAKPKYAWMINGIDKMRKYLIESGEI